MTIRNEIAELSTGRVTKDMLDRLESEVPLPLPQKEGFGHRPGTAYKPLSELVVHPNNPRNHGDTLLGIAVPSSLRIPEMMESILLTGDITEPLVITGNKCHSKPGTVLKGNRRLEALRQLERDGKLPEVLRTRGIPVDVRNGTTEPMELHELFDHGGSIPLNPTECFRSILSMQEAGYTPEEIVFRHPGLVAGYMRKTLPPIPADETERKKWYASIRDTLKYSILSWGLFPATFLPARILLIQEEKEGMYTGKEKPKYSPFKPTTQRAKQLYKAMLADKNANKWRKDGSSPEFSALVAKFTTDDSPSTSAASASTTVNEPTPEATPLATVQMNQMKETVGNAVPLVAAVLDYAQTGNKPEGFHDAIKATGFAVALADNITTNPGFWEKRVGKDVYATIVAKDMLALASIVSAK